MKEPKQPYKPHDSSKNIADYYLIKEDVVLKRIYYNDDKYTEEQYLDEVWKDQNDWEEGDPLPKLYPLIRDNSFTLTEIIAAIPDGVSHDNITISFNIDDYGNDFTLVVINTIHLNKQDVARERKEQYNRDLVEYNALLKQYEKDIVIYNELKLKNEIKNLEDQLAEKKAALNK